MSILGGVYTFFGPIIGAFLLLFMDADITQDYPEIWQLFLGAVMVLILYGLPGGIMGFIQSRDIASADDYATRMRKSMAEFKRKFWYFFVAVLVFSGFFMILKAPEMWVVTLLITLGRPSSACSSFPGCSVSSARLRRAGAGVPRLSPGPTGTAHHAPDTPLRINAYRPVDSIYLQILVAS